MLFSSGPKSAPDIFGNLRRRSIEKATQDSGLSLGFVHPHRRTSLEVRWPMPLYTTIGIHIEIIPCTQRSVMLGGTLIVLRFVRDSWDSGGSIARGTPRFQKTFSQAPATKPQASRGVSKLCQLESGCISRARLVGVNRFNHTRH